MKKLILAIAVIAMCGLGVSCNKEEIENPETNVPQKIVDLFPNASSIEENGSLITVMDKKGNVLGYLLNSKPASDGIEGKFGETPLEIRFDGSKVVTDVEMLPNQETESFVDKIKKHGLLDSWNGLGVDEALNKKVDVVSGATKTSKSIIKTFRTAVEVNMK